MASKDVSFNINKFISGKGNVEPITVEVDEVLPAEKPKRTRKKKEDSESNLPAPVAQTSMSYVQDKIPYMTSYQETNKQLDAAIMQLDYLGAGITTELEHIKNSKTLKNKFVYINDMTSTASSIISAKISAIKEKNQSINNVHRLELQRIKDLNAQAQSAEDENAKIANMYNAFINTPVGVGSPAVLGPSIQDMMMPTATSGLTQYSIGGAANDQEAWEQSLSPANNRMVLQAKGAIETVVVYDNASGNRWYEVVDKTTGQPVPNVEKPDNSNIYDLDINVRGGFAKNSLLNITYPLKVINQDSGSPINEY